MSKMKSKFFQNPIRSWCIHQSLDYPWRTIIISLLLTLLVGSGVRFFLIDDDGVIHYKHIGALTVDVWAQKFLPIINELKQ